MSDKSIEYVSKHIRMSPKTLEALQKEADKTAAGNISYVIRNVLDKHCAKINKK